VPSVKRAMTPSAPATSIDSRLLPHVIGTPSRRTASRTIREQEIWALYEPLGRGITGLVRQYDAAERATILAFLLKACEVLEAETTRLRQDTA
jgi:hypothetical protein